MAKNTTKKNSPKKAAVKPKAVAKKTASKPVKKAAKPAAKKKPAAPAKPVKKTTKPAAKAAKPNIKVAAKSAKPVKKAPTNVPMKSSKKEEPKKQKAKEEPKKKVSIVKAKETAKPIKAIEKKAKPTSKAKKSKKEESDEEDVDVEDDYEKPDDEDSIDGDLEEPAMLEVEVAVDIDDDDEDEIKPRGRGRRKKVTGKSSFDSESYIRNRPLQIDLTKPLVKKVKQEQPKPFVNTDDNRTRYSDKELAEFKEIILEKIAEAQIDYDLLKQTLSNSDNHGTDDTSPTFKLLEDGSDVLSKEETAQLASRQEKYIVSLKNALVRIENKAYGICRVTGKLIPKERLRSVPHATLGIDAKLNQSS